MFSRFLSAWLMCVSLAATADSGDLVRIGDLWRFQKLPAAASPPDRNWAQREFDDSRWRFAASGLQIVDEDVGLAPRGAPGYIFQRRAFTVRDPASIRALVLRVEHEEGYVAYLNGVEVARHQGRGIRYPTPEDIAAGMEDPLLTLGVHDLSEARSLLIEGENVLSVEGAYTGESASLLSLAATLTANFTRGPFIQNSTTGSVQIIWRTATPASSVVRYGLSPSLSQTAMSSELVTEHVVTLTGLAPDTKYFYQVCSTNSDDPEPMCGNVEWFRTLKSAGPITFAALGDSGDGSSAQSQIASVLRGLGAELVIHVGDLVYGGFSDATADTRIFNFYQPHMKNTPFFCTPGNHEHNCCGGIDDRGITNYQNVFYLPTNSVTGTEHFYSFDHGDAHFVSLYNPWFANYVFTNESPQFMWLTNDLAMSNKKWKFLFFHSPAAHSGLHAGRDNDNNGVPDQTQVIELLLPAAVTYGVQLIFAGHDHNFEKFAPSNGV
ncbi:MAG: metallophosphoesterase family protein, partial [Verrucomicrobia subdivision 3 bacterium]|nr:metallophosphoesterase family protein [Limisphaerales bacterium]